MKAMIPGKKFELWKRQAAVALAALREMGIQVVVIRAVAAAVIRAVPAAVATRAVGIQVVAIRAEAIRVAPLPAASLGEAIRPTEDSKIPTRTLKTSPKCNR